jgi:lipoprotein-anchoring transpeptidase ErfK/SrfK
MRFQGGFLLILAAAALLPAVPASAQGYGGPVSVYSEPLPPPGGPGQRRYQDVETYPVQADPRDRHYYPGTSAAPDYDARPGRPPVASAEPAYGHQLDSQSPLGVNESDVIRPPRGVGPAPAPAAAAVTSQPSGAPAPASQQSGYSEAVPGGTTVMALPPEDQPETGTPKELPANLKKQLVDFQTKEPAGTIIVDTPNTYLYLVLGHGKALRYGIGVGREGFTWAGTERISRMKEWPDWFPPTEMIERQPYLPRVMAGGPGNPLGARALYLGNTLYRIHGTNQPSTIGQTVSSGCIRLLNEDIEDLYSRVQVGTRVVVLPGKAPENLVSAAPQPQPVSVQGAVQTGTQRPIR